MQKFFICTASVAKGPYQLEDLLSLGIHEKDLIWSMSLGMSKYAMEIDELKAYFRKNKFSKQHSTALRKPSSTIVKNAVLFSLLFVLAGMVAYYFSM